MDDLDAWGRKVGLLVAALDGSSMRKIIGTVAGAGKNDALGVLDTDLPGRKFRNWRPHLGAGYELVSDYRADLTPRPSGPSKVLNDGRTPGRKFSRKAGRLEAWGATTGRHTWDRTADIVNDRTPARVSLEVAQLVGRVIGA